MTLYPLEPEVRGRVLADHRDRRGPFARGILLPHDLVGYYGVQHVKRLQAGALLRELGAVVLKARPLRSTTPQTTLYILDPVLKDLRPMEALAEFRRERGLPHV
jgi:hypothetical protein